MYTFDIIYHIFQFFETTFYKNFEHIKTSQCNIYSCQDCNILSSYTWYEENKFKISNINKNKILNIFNMRHINLNFSIVFFKSNASQFYFKRFNYNDNFFSKNTIIKLPDSIETQLKYFKINEDILYYLIYYDVEINLITNLPDILLVKVINILHNSHYGHGCYEEVMNELSNRFQQNKNFTYWLSFSSLHIVKYFHKTFNYYNIENIDKELRILIHTGSINILQYLHFTMKINLNENIISEFDCLLPYYEYPLLHVIELLTICSHDLESKEFLDKMFKVIYFACEHNELKIIKYLYKTGFRKKHFRLNQIIFNRGQTLIERLIKYRCDKFHQYILEKDLI